MKTRIYLAALCTAATLAAGCDNNNEPDNQPQKDYTECLEYYEYFDDVVLRNGKKPSELVWLKDFMQEELEKKCCYMQRAWLVRCPVNDYIATHSIQSSLLWSNIFTLDGEEISADDIECEEDRAFMNQYNAYDFGIPVVNLPDSVLGDFVELLLEIQK